MAARLAAAALVLGLIAAPGLAGTEPARLREDTSAVAATHVLSELRAEGKLTPARLPGGPEPESVPTRVESRFDFLERVTARTAEGRPARAVRHVRQAAVASNSPARPLTTVVRSEVSTLVARLRDGAVVSYSPGGPMSRQELDIVQAAADPLLWSGFLPAGPVAPGDTWPIAAELARSLSDYEALASNTLRARLETLDDDTAVIQVAGEVRGAVRGGEGEVVVAGTVTFDRRRNLITRLELERTEARRPGFVEAGLDFKGTLDVKRTPLDVPPELADAVLEAIPRDDPPALERLRFTPPDGRYVIYHDRDWHLFWEDARLAVLKRLDTGEILAQCNLSVGPDAGTGRHQDPAQFRQDIKEALGKRFIAFVGSGEITEEAEAGFRYKVAVQGRESDRDILWYYYLVASPAGRQVLATFTLNLADKDRLGNGDLEIVGSLEWLEDGPQAPSGKPAN